MRTLRRGDRFSALGDTAPGAGLGVPAWGTPEFAAYASGYYGAVPATGVDFRTLPGYSAARNTLLYGTPALYAFTMANMAGTLPAGITPPSQVASNIISPSAAADFGVQPTVGAGVAISPIGQQIQAPVSTSAAAGSSGAVAPAASLPSWIPAGLTQPVNVPLLGSVPLVYLIGGAGALLFLLGGKEHL